MFRITFYLYVALVSLVDLIWRIGLFLPKSYTAVCQCGFLVAHCSVILLIYVKSKGSILEIMLRGVVIFLIRGINGLLFELTGLFRWLLSVVYPEASRVDYTIGLFFGSVVQIGNIVMIVLHCIIWGIVWAICGKTLFAPSIKRDRTVNQA